MATTVLKVLSLASLLAVALANIDTSACCGNGDDCYHGDCNYFFNFCQGPKAASACMAKITVGEKCRPTDEWGTSSQTCGSGLCINDVCVAAPSTDFHDPPIMCATATGEKTSCSSKDPCKGMMDKCRTKDDPVRAHSSPWGATCAKYLFEETIYQGCDKNLCALWSANECCVVPETGEKLICKPVGEDFEEGSQQSDFDDCTEPCSTFNSGSAVGPSLVILTLGLSALFN